MSDIAPKDAQVPAGDHVEIRFCIPLDGDTQKLFTDIPREVLEGSAEMLLRWLIEDDQLAIRENEGTPGATWRISVVRHQERASEGGVYEDEEVVDDVAPNAGSVV